MENIVIQMVTITSENSKMIKEMVMGYSNGLIKGDMKECGRMESKMVKEDIMI